MLKIILLTLSLSLATGSVGLAAENFQCSGAKGICTCDVATTGDCDLMKRMCDEGKIGWCKPGTTKCSCAIAKKLAPSLLQRLPQMQVQ